MNSPKHPEIHFLERRAPLAMQAADVLLEGLNAFPIDLGDTQVWIPTAGAGRAIRRALAQLASKKNTGVLSPRFLQPMQALLPENPSQKIASRSEREAAWAKILLQNSDDKWNRLLPNPAVRDTVSGLLGAGGMLCDLCDLLAEGALSPGDPRIGKICEEEAARWEQFGPLYEEYLILLESASLSDPNACRLQMLTNAGGATHFRRVVVACIPDLPSISISYLEQLAKNGVAITILVWKPGLLAAGFDAWGRPSADEWIAATLPILPKQIKVARRAEDEAIAALDFIAAAEKPGDYALALADESLTSTFAAEIVRRDGIPFSPEGKKLAEAEATVVVLGWESFKREGDLRVLRNLAQCPHFANWLGGAANLAPSQILAACDFLISTPLAETVAGAQSFLSENKVSPNERHSPNMDAAATMIGALADLRDVSLAKLLEEAWRGSATDSDTSETNQVLEILRELSSSSIFNDWPEAREAAFLRALQTSRTFESAPPESLELVGWLEVPWLEGTRLAICGCVEGSLPASVNEHAFLPDSRRKLLGLMDNDRRLARDAYLLNCILIRTNEEDLQLSFSKFGADGSPSLPSRLLLRCVPDALPSRVMQVFGDAATSRSQPARKNGWRWHLPEKLRKTEINKISPTAFKDYLACPFRFYWKHVLRLDAFDNDPREMDAGRFGQLVHSTLEAFAKTAPHETRVDKIESIVFEQLEIEALKAFGPSPVAAVRVQLEAIKVRLRAFARAQAAEFAAGWRIVEVEKRFSANELSALKVGALPISAQVDRIEEHAELGLRIMDYKTFSLPKTPEKTHFGSAATNDFLPEAKVLRNDKEKCWVDLQLPLYRAIAEQHYPGIPVQTAYFVLPADPDQTSVAYLDLSDGEYQSAMKCAEAVAEQVNKGIFWPPQSHEGSWADPFAPLFLNGRPENCLTESTIDFLRGRP